MRMWWKCTNGFQTAPPDRFEAARAALQKLFADIFHLKGQIRGKLNSNTDFMQPSQGMRCAVVDDQLPDSVRQ